MFGAIFQKAHSAPSSLIDLMLHSPDKGLCDFDRTHQAAQDYKMLKPGVTLYDVRPHACASIFHSSPCFENVYARVPVRVVVWPLMVTASVPAMTAYASEPV